MDKALNTLLPQLGEAVKQMAQAMGVAAEHLYGVLVRQMVAESVGGLIVNLFWFIVGGAVVFATVKLVRMALKDEAYEAAVAAVAIGGVISLLVFGINVSNTSDNVVKLINPEYHAIERIIDKAKQD